MPGQVLEEMVQVSGRSTAPAKVQVWVGSQLSVCLAARLDDMRFLCIGTAGYTEEATGERFQVLL